MSILDILFNKIKFDLPEYFIITLIRNINISEEKIIYVKLTENTDLWYHEITGR